jgi:hypothetical protein
VVLNLAADHRVCLSADRVELLKLVEDYVDSSSRLLEDPCGKSESRDKRLSASSAKVH